MSTTTRTNPKAVRFTLTAPGRARLIEQAQEAGSADHRAMQLLHRPDTAAADSVIEHLREALRLAVRARELAKASSANDFGLAQSLGRLEVAR